TRYPYGYGRAEDLGGVAIVMAIWSGAVLAGWRSYDKLVSSRGTSHLELGMVAAVVGGGAGRPHRCCPRPPGRATALGVSGVNEVSDLRVRWLGRELEIRMLIHLPAGLSLTQAHDVAHRVQDSIRAEVSDVREVMVEPAPPAERAISSTTSPSSG